MKKTGIQKFTIAFFVLYVVWEIVVQIWAMSETGPIIRADLILIYPILIVLILISTIQYFRQKNS